MLLHNWQEAAVYYNSYIQALEARNSIKVHPTASEVQQPFKLGQVDL